MTFSKSTALIFGCALLVGTSVSAEAMTLVVAKGEVRVSRGAGFVPVSGSLPVEPGSAVMVYEGGEAELICTESDRIAFIEPGYYPVPADCASGQTLLESLNTTLEPLGAAGPLLVGVGVLGGAIAIIRNSDDQPVSR